MAEKTTQKQIRVKVSEAALRLGIDESTLRRAFGKRVSGPVVDDNGKKFMRWPLVQQQWLSGRPLSTQHLVGIVDDLRPPSNEPPKPGSIESKIRYGEDATKLKQVKTVEATLKAKKLQTELEQNKKMLPISMRLEIAKTEKEEAASAKSIIDLHVQTKRLMDVEELEDRMRERDSVIRDRLGTLSTKMRGDFPELEQIYIQAIDKFMAEILNTLGQGILTEDERDQANESIRVMSTRERAPSDSEGDTDG